MLAVDERRAAVGGLAGRQQQRVAVRAHERIGRQHRAEAERGIAEIALGHAHQHSGHEEFAATARAALAIIDAVNERVAHQHPIAKHGVNAFVRRGVGQPARARSFARHRIGAEEALHLHLMPAHVVAGVRALHPGYRRCPPCVPPPMAWPPCFMPAISCSPWPSFELFFLSVDSSGSLP